MIKLYDLPRNKGIKIRVEEGDITFHHIDGAYSFCTCDWLPDGENVVHLSAITQLEDHGDYYVIAGADDQKGEEERNYHGDK